jgi:hypothetical protein
MLDNVIKRRFASLGMSAMGVYFSIQGLMMTFQQGSLLKV